MNKILHIGSRLAIICAGAALVLGLVNALTAPVIERRGEEALNATLSFLIEEGDIGSPQTLANEESLQFPGVKAYYPVSSGGELVSYVLDLRGDGYGGEMRILASFSVFGEVLAAKLMDNEETPGLGKKAEDSAYMNKFQGTGGTSPVPVRKSQLARQADVDSVSGATITFMGVARALSEGSEMIRQLEISND